MNIFPLLRTERLILRKIKIEDFDNLVKYANNKNISDRIINIPHPYGEPDAAFRMSYVVTGFRNKSHFVFSIIDKFTQEFIGEISLHLRTSNKAELGFWIGEPFWGKGLMTEATNQVLKFGFETLQLESIFATCHIENQGSNKVCTKIGMLCDSTFGSVNTYSIRQNAY